MTDTHDGDTERQDPVLVRPYVKKEMTSVAGAEAPETWPEDAPLPDEPGPGDAGPGDADTVIQPAVADEPVPPAPPVPRTGMSLPVRLLVLAGGVVLALAVGGYLIFGTGGDPRPQPGLALPQLPAEAPAGQAAASAAPSASTGRSPSPSASSSASPSASVSASVSAPVSAAAPVTPSAAPTSATPTLAPPPAGDRTGAVTAASGRCLALGSLLGMAGSPVQVNSCADIAYQRFTLAGDGTLKVNGRCAQPADGGTIRVADCADAGSAQWRGGQNGSLVNTSTGQCLTDPGRAAANTTVAACTGGADQTWTLP